MKARVSSESGSSLANRTAKVKKNDTKSICNLTYKDVLDILEIIDDSACGELHLELEDLNLTVIKREGCGVLATGKSLEVREAQRGGMTPQNPGARDTRDFRKAK